MTDNKKKSEYHNEKIWDNISHSLSWQKFKSMTKSSVGKNVEEQKLLYTANGSIDCYNHVGKQFGLT